MEKIPWIFWQPALVFLPGKFPRTKEPGGVAKRQTVLSDYVCTGELRSSDCVSPIISLLLYSSDVCLVHLLILSILRGIKIAGKYVNNLRYVDDTTSMAESEGELKSFLMRVKEEHEKFGFTLNIKKKKKKTKIIASGPITS